MQITNTTNLNAKCCCCNTSNSFADLKELHFDGAYNRFGICVTLCKRCRDKLIENIRKIDVREEDPIDSAEMINPNDVKPLRLLQRIPSSDEMAEMSLDCVPVGHLYKWGDIFFYKKTDQYIFEKPIGNAKLLQTKPNVITLHNMHNAVQCSKTRVYYIGEPLKWLTDSALKRLDEKLAADV